MGYKQRPTVRIDLSELGDNNGTPFFIDIKNPRFLTYGEKMESASIAAESKKDENGKIIMDKATSLKMAAMAKSYIVAWNLIDKETEQPVNANDENALDHVPSEVVEAIFNKIGEKNKKADEEQKNSLGQSDKS